MRRLPREGPAEVSGSSTIPGNSQVTESMSLESHNELGWPELRAADAATSQDESELQQSAVDVRLAQLLDELAGDDGMDARNVLQRRRWG